MNRKLNQKLLKALGTMTAMAVLSATVAGCAATQTNSQSSGASTTATQTATAASTSVVAAAGSATGASVVSTAASGTSLLDTTDIFSTRDLEQTPDLSGATVINLVSGQDVTLSEEGVYVLKGMATDVSVVVAAAEDAKIQVVLDGVRITNTDAPAIYVKTADKVFLTTTASQNVLTVTGTYAADGETKLDAVIFSKADLTLNGSGSLEIVSSTGNGISAKDELIVTGGVYTIQAAADGLEANDAILIGNGTLTIEAGQDALHSENADDPSLGFIYIQNGALTITAADDALRGNSFIQIDGGTVNVISSQEGIEATQIMLNGGQITVYATDDGINGAPKVSSDVDITVNGGTISVKVGSGDTDAFDCNGDITINGGTITVTANSAFDADGTAVLNAGDVTVNGTKITQITQSQQGGGPGGHMRG